MKTRYRLVATMAVCCALTCGCVLSEHHEGGNNGWFTLTKNSDYGFLLVLRNLSYSSCSASCRKGELDEATGAALQDLLTPESIRQYVEIQREVGWDDRCLQEGVHITFWNQGAACWFPTKVTDEATNRMLDFLLSLHERLRP